MDLPLSGRLSTLEVPSVFLLLAAASFLYWTVWSLYDVYFGPMSKYPGPKLNAFSRIPRVLVLMRGGEAHVFARYHAKYGPVVRVGPRELSFAEGAQAWKDIYGFKKHGQAQPFKPFFFFSIPVNGVHAVVSTPDNIEHGRQRKALSHAFSDKALKDQEPLIKKWASLLRRKLAEKAASGAATDMLKMYNCTTFDVMGDLTFSEGLNMLEEGEYSAWVKTIFGSIKIATIFRGFKMTGQFASWFVEKIVFKSKRARQLQWDHWEYTQTRVDRRLAREPQHPDLWTKILEKSEEDGGLSTEEHRSNGALFMIAGTETTATALSGTTYQLLRHPQYLQKLVEEIRTTFADFDDVTLEALARMKYMQAVLQEGMRMYPPIPIGLPRETPEGGANVCGDWIPGGVTVACSQFSTYRLEDNFKDPYAFRPERWLGDPAYEDDRRDAMEPFSVGPRNCLGKNLAWHEMRVLLVAVLLHFDVKLCDNSDDWADQKVYTLWEKKPLMCTLTPAAA